MVFHAGKMCAGKSPYWNQLPHSCKKINMEEKKIKNTTKLYASVQFQIRCFAFRELTWQRERGTSSAFHPSLNYRTDSISPFLWLAHHQRIQWEVRRMELDIHQPCKKVPESQPQLASSLSAFLFGCGTKEKNVYLNPKDNLHTVNKIGRGLFLVLPLQTNTWITLCYFKW